MHDELLRGMPGMYHLKSLFTTTIYKILCIIELIRSLTLKKRVKPKLIEVLLAIKR